MVFLKFDADACSDTTSNLWATVISPCVDRLYVLQRISTLCALEN